MVQRIATRHPDPQKSGVSIARGRYDLVRGCIVDCLRQGQLTYTGLAKEAEQRLAGKLDGSIRWYVEVVKLDLEARGLIERVPKTKPQLYRLAATGG